MQRVASSVDCYLSVKGNDVLAMKFYTFSLSSQNDHRIGVDLDGMMLDLNAAHAARLGSKKAWIASNMIEFIEKGGKALTSAKMAIEFAKKNKGNSSRGFLLPFTKLKIHAPIPRPGKIWCSGLNYMSHIHEEGATPLKDPRFFSKLPECVIGPGEAIRHPGKKFKIDWEVELAVVIGKPAFRLTQKNAMNHVFGYTILNDVSDRYLQFKDNNEQMGKNFATFAPLGPCIVTKDEIPNPEKCRLTLKVNGKIKQDFSNSDWCFPLVRLLEWLSMPLQLKPGDIVSTGTGGGIGLCAKPPTYLKPGDVCELEISGIGILRNHVVSDPYTFRAKPNS